MRAAIHLSGPSAVGKTTLCPPLARRLGARCVEPPTPPAAGGAEAQRDRLAALLHTAPGPTERIVVADSPLTAYGYARAYSEQAEGPDTRAELDKLAAAAEEAIEKRLDAGHVFLLLTADPRELEKRAATRRAGRSRFYDTALHARAQQYMASLARDLGIPRLDTTGLTVEETLAEALRLAASALADRILAPGWLTRKAGPMAP